MMTIATLFLVHCVVSWGSCIVSDVNGDYIYSSNVANYSDGNLYFNPGRYTKLDSLVHINGTIPPSLPWRLQYLSTIDSCQNSPFPVYIDLHFSLMVDLLGSSVLISFDFYANDSIPFLRILRDANVIAVGVDPTNTSEWSKVNGATCGRSFDTIVDFNGTHLTVYFDSSRPWVVTNMTFNSTVTLGWKLSTNSVVADFYISNVSLLQNCSWVSPQLRSKNCTTVNISDYSPDSFSFTFGTAYKASNFVNGSVNLLTDGSVAAWMNQMFDVATEWKISFDVWVYDCVLNAGCFGDGLAFVIQNEAQGLKFIGGGGGALGFGNPTNQNLFALTLDFYGGCVGARGFGKIVYYTLNSTNSTLIFTPAQAVTCFTSYPVVIGYNTTHISLIFNGSSTSYPFGFSKFILNDNKKGYLGWTLGVGGARMKANITNIKISQPSRTECVYVPNPPIPALAPIPIPLPVNVPDGYSPLPSTLNPSPNPSSVNINTICSSKCESINQTITLSNGTYFLPNTILDHLTITLDTPSLHSQGNLSIDSSTLLLNTNTFFESGSGEISIKNSQIYFDDGSKLGSSGAINLNNVTFHLSDQLIKNEKQIVLIESRTQLTVSIMNIIPKPPCSNLQISSYSIVLALNSCENKMNYTNIGIIVGTLMGVTLIIGVLCFFNRERVQEKRLEVFMTKMKSTSNRTQ